VVGSLDGPLLAPVAVRRGGEGLVLPVLFPPFNLFVTALAESVVEDLLDLFGFFAVLIVLERKLVLVLGRASSGRSPPQRSVWHRPGIKR